MRTAGSLQGLLSDDDEDLHHKLDKVFAIGSGDSKANEIRRAQELVGVWKEYDAAQQALTPPKTPLIMKQGLENVTATQFAQLLADTIAAQQAQTDAGRASSSARTALHVADRKADRGNKRWYAVWTKTYLPGTAEGDAARSTIPTEAGQPQPTALQIYSATPQAGRVVGLIYAEGGGAHAKTLELLYQLPGEPDFGHEQKVILDGQLVGPFPPNTLVGLRTRVSNSHAGVVWGDIVQVLIPA